MRYAQGGGLTDERRVFHGWPDQTWTLSRIKTLIGRRFHKSYTVQGVAALLKRHGWSCQVPARRAVERDDAAVAGWVKETWPDVEGPWRRSTAGSSSKTRLRFPRDAGSGDSGSDGSHERSPDDACPEEVPAGVA
jgi:Winged helix-turn helix